MIPVLRALVALLLLSLVAIPATAADNICISDGAGGYVCFAKSAAPVDLWDWLNAMRPPGLGGAMVFGDGRAVDNAILDGTDNSVAAWIYVLPKPLKPGKSFYVSKTRGSSVLAAVVFRNGNMAWNQQVDNAALGLPGTFHFGGRFQLPGGFFQRLPKKR